MDMIKNKTISRQDFTDLMLSSVYDINTFNDKINTLGITIKPYITYKYFKDNEFICSTEDLCVDDLIEAAGYQVEKL